MKKISTLVEFNKLKAETMGADGGLVVHFSASWCEPCSAVNTHLESAAKAYSGHVTFVEVDCEASADIAESEGVDRVPFVLFYRFSSERGVMEPVAEVSGAKLESIDLNLRSLYGTQRSSFSSLNEYLKFLTTRPGIVMFITGTPSRPRCGFTGKLCELVESLSAPYTYYDVMASEEVCESLKTYSEWPTYPQVYVDGELIGGWDICKELHDGGELKASLKMK